MLMPLSDMLLGIVVGGAVCAIFAYIIYILAQKHKAQKEELVNSLTDEQKEKLMNASLNDNTLTVGLIATEPKVGNTKTELKVLAYNMYYPNMMNDFMLADISISAKQYNTYNLKQGDYIKISLDQNGAKVVFDK